MARYIDADALIKQFECYGGVFLYGQIGVKSIVSRIKMQPTADVVEVVRCKNCTHGEVSIMSRSKDGKTTWGCYCNVSNKVTDVDSYCPMGKKRGNEDDKQ